MKAKELQAAHEEARDANQNAAAAHAVTIWNPTPANAHKAWDSTIEAFGRSARAQNDADDSSAEADAYNDAKEATNHAEDAREGRGQDGGPVKHQKQVDPDRRTADAARAMVRHQKAARTHGHAADFWKEIAVRDERERAEEEEAEQQRQRAAHEENKRQALINAATYHEKAAREHEGNRRRKQAWLNFGPAHATRDAINATPEPLHEEEKQAIVEANKSTAEETTDVERKAASGKAAAWHKAAAKRLRAEAAGQK
jgi:hypothetical protein